MEGDENIEMKWKNCGRFCLYYRLEESVISGVYDIPFKKKYSASSQVSLNSSWASMKRTIMFQFGEDLFMAKILK